jgi:hypothetical protein
VAWQLPEYDFFAVRPKEESASASSAAGGAAPTGAGEPLASAAEPEPAPGHSDVEPNDGLLYPPGPLDRVEVAPRALRLPPLASRSLRAQALDADGRPCAGEVRFSWQLEGPGELSSEGRRAQYTSPDLEPDDAPSIRIVVRAEQDDRRAEACAGVRIAFPAAPDRSQGIPDPHPVTAPGEPWRSRVIDGRWEYNDAHRDYLAAADVEARRLRYLIHLFAKEVVLRNFGRPGDAETLERMVEVLTRLDGAGRK